MSYAITQSSRGGGGIEKEQQMIDEALNQQCAASVEHGIMRLKLIGGCAAEEISYEIADGRNENPENEDNTSCFLFHSDGAGVAPCGEYEDPSVETGLIALNDTESIALVGASTYITCPTWTAGDCMIRFSPNGTDFRQGCLFDDTTHWSRDIYPVAEASCQAMCGGSFSYEMSSGSGGPAYYVNEDFSLTEVTGTCTNYVDGYACSCH